MKEVLSLFITILNKGLIPVIKMLEYASKPTIHKGNQLLVDMIKLLPTSRLLLLIFLFNGPEKQKLSN